MNLSEIAQKLGCRLDGAPDTEIHGIAGIEHAEPGQITFLANRRYFPLLKTTRASAVLVEDGINIERDPGMPAIAALRTANPYLAFAHAIELFYQAPRYEPDSIPRPSSQEAPKSAKALTSDPTASWTKMPRSAAMPSCTASSPSTTARTSAMTSSPTPTPSSAKFCRIGNRVILQNGAIIGGDGLGFAKQKDGTWYKMQQSGPAVLEDDVEVQSNACVDRATVGETRIGRGTKLDDLVLVGHASQVGANTMLCGQVGLAGSTKVGAAAFSPARSALPVISPSATAR